MILDGTWQSLSISDTAVISVPIWCFHRSYLATVLSLELGTAFDDGEKWKIYGHAVKRMLKILEPRCKLAGEIFLSI
jgi:hypothetical protein